MVTRNPKCNFCGRIFGHFFSVKWRLIRTSLHWHIGLTPDFNIEKTYDREDPENRTRLITEVQTSEKTIQSAFAIGTRVNMRKFQFEDGYQESYVQFLRACFWSIFSVKWRQQFPTSLYWHMELTPDCNIEKTYDREDPENRAWLILEVKTSGKTIQSAFAVGTRVNTPNFQFLNGYQEYQVLLLRAYFWSIYFFGKWRQNRTSWHWHKGYKPPISTWKKPTTGWIPKTAPDWFWK